VTPPFVIPAKAGIQITAVQDAKSVWTPAFAGVTLSGSIRSDF
jgi:hypothetical protein